MISFEFEIGQVVEMVHGEKENKYKIALIRRFVKKESVVKELIDLSGNKDGDLFEVRKRYIRKCKNNVEFDLYLCQNLKTKEFTLFGRSGIRKHK